MHASLSELELEFYAVAISEVTIPDGDVWLTGSGLDLSYRNLGALDAAFEALPPMPRSPLLVNLFRSP